MCELLAGCFPLGPALCAAGVGSARPFPPSPVARAGAPRGPQRMFHASGSRSTRAGWHTTLAFFDDVGGEGLGAPLGAAGVRTVVGLGEGCGVASHSPARGWGVRLSCVAAAFSATCASKRRRLRRCLDERSSSGFRVVAAPSEPAAGVIGGGLGSLRGAHSCLSRNTMTPCTLTESAPEPRTRSTAARTS